MTEETKKTLKIKIPFPEEEYEIELLEEDLNKSVREVVAKGIEKIEEKYRMVAGSLWEAFDESHQLVIGGNPIDESDKLRNYLKEEETEGKTYLTAEIEIREI